MEAISEIVKVKLNETIEPDKLEALYSQIEDIDLTTELKRKWTI